MASSSLYLSRPVIRFSLLYLSLPPRLLSRARIKPYLSYGFLCPELDKTLNKGWKKMSEFQIQKFILDDIEEIYKEKQNINFSLKTLDNIEYTDMNICVLYYYFVANRIIAK